MTSCAMIAGMVPMALAWSEGGEQTAPLARAVVGGLAAATLATLVVLPTVYALVQGKASLESASLDPDDPASPHHHDEVEEESREPAQPSDNGAPLFTRTGAVEGDPNTSATSGHDRKF